jgi:regulator of cell morphogenesis and NO signaling
MNEQNTRQGGDASEKTIGELVAADYRAAKVFEKYGIDFCCGGKVPLLDACREKGIDPVAISGEIEAAGNEPMEQSQNYAAWGLPFLADYIINTHHAYLDENMHKISAYADKIAQVHGDMHPELIEIVTIFARIATDMAAHLREEEEVFFPAIKRIDAAARSGTEPDAGDRETIKICLAKLDHEHEVIGDAVHTIRDLSNNYAIPGDVCNTFMLTYRMLKKFEDDLHKHVHLENNILFPKAAKLSIGA